MELLAGFWAVFVPNILFLLAVWIVAMLVIWVVRQVLESRGW